MTRTAPTLGCVSIPQPRLRPSRTLTALTLAALAFTLTVSAPTLTAHATTLEPSTTITTWNILKANTPTAPSWQQRRTAMQNTLLATGSDALALTEVTQHAIAPGITQRDDVTALLAPTYQPAPTDINECIRPRDSTGQLTGPNPCTHTATIYFNPTTTRVADTPNATPTSGRLLASTIAPTLSPTAGSREVSYAFLQPVNSPTPYLLIAAHLPNGQTPTAENDRTTFASDITTWAQNLTTTAGWPTIAMVLAGDLNSFRHRQPAGAQKILTDNGWTDPFYGPLETKKGGQYATINITPNTRSANGFPTTPHHYTPKREPTRIDYILLRGPITATNYETIVHLTPKGTFDPTYRASDHNAVTVTATLTP